MTLPSTSRWMPQPSERDRQSFAEVGSSRIDTRIYCNDSLDRVRRRYLIRRWTLDIRCWKFSPLSTRFASEVRDEVNQGGRSFVLDPIRNVLPFSCLGIQWRKPRREPCRLVAAAVRSGNPQFDESLWPLGLHFYFETVSRYISVCLSLANTGL